MKKILAKSIAEDSTIQKKLPELLPCSGACLIHPSLKAGASAFGWLFLAMFCLAGVLFGQASFT